MKITPELVILVIVIIWSGVLTALFFKFYFHYVRLIRNGKKESLSALLDEVIKREEVNEKTIENMHKRYLVLEKEGNLHIQKVGLIRFNPFKDTGGDQSFILALVDGEDSGVVVSSLHTRAGTRWYAKRIVRGKGVEYELSEEEKKAIKGAKYAE